MLQHFPQFWGKIQEKSNLAFFHILRGHLPKVKYLMYSDKWYIKIKEITHWSQYWKKNNKKVKPFLKYLHFSHFYWKKKTKSQNRLLSMLSGPLHFCTIGVCMSIEGFMYVKKPNYQVSFATCIQFGWRFGT